MFGQQQRAPFGGTTSTFGFGTPTTTATTGFGASSFGRPAFGTPQQTTSFGTSSSTPFGAATSSGTSLFGSQPQQTSGGLFGQQQTQASTGFSQASTGFGSTSGGGLFGQTQQPATGQLTTGGLFGSSTTPGFGTQQSTQNRPFGFGQTTTSSTTTSGGLFGSTPSTAGGLFGASTGFGGATGAVSGTTIKYEPLTGSDTMTRNGVSTNIRTRIEVISTMKEYENKSLEELRVEDYLANRKGPGQGTTLPGFGQTQQQQQQQQQQPGGQLGSTGLFGTTTSTSLFGSKPPENKSLFGTGTSTGFGGTTGGSLFGTTTTPAFGQPSTTASAGFSFAQNTQQKTSGFNFGATPTSTPSLFGSTPQQPQSAFGIGGGFPLGQNNPQQQNPGGLFGTQNKPGGGFLSNQTTGGGLFGNKPTGIAQPLGTGFGTTSTVAPFGTSTNTNTATGLFGQQNAQNKTGIFSNFGNNPGFGNTGPFGQNNNQPKPGGLNFAPFGAGSNMGQGLVTSTGGGLFGTAPTNANISGTGLFNTNPGFLGQTNNLGAGGVGGSLYPDLGKLVRAMTEKPVFDIPIGGSKSAGSTDKTSVGSPGDQSNKATISSLKPTYVLSPSLVANNKPRPKPINKTTNQGNNRHWLFKGLEDPNEESSEDFLKPKKYPSVRKLNLKVFKKEESVPSSLQLGEDVTEGDMASPLTVPVSPLGDTTPLRVNGPPSHENSPTPDIIKGRGNVKRLTLAEKSLPVDDTLADLNVNHLRVREEEEENNADEDKENNNNSNNDISLFNASGDADDLPEMNKTSDQPHPAGIKCTRSGYYTLPSLEDLAEIMTEEGKCEPENFTVGRYGYGNVCFLGKTDVTGLDVDSTVFILRKQLEVYPEGTQKPPHGQQLNKPAIITLDCVWPVDKSSREVIKSSERLEAMGWGDYLERQCVKMEANFIEYRPETGSWVFKVKHFSKYGLQEDNDDEMTPLPPRPQEGPPPSATTTQPPPAAPLRISTAGPPATALTSPPQFPHTHSTSPPKQVCEGRFLEGNLEEPRTPDDDYMDSTVAREPEESASLCVLSPSSERLTVASRVVPRAVQLAKSQLFGMDEEDEDDRGHTRGTRETTPTPHVMRVSSKKLMLGGDVSLNQSRGGTASPVPPQITADLKARVLLQPQPLSPPPNKVVEESDEALVLREPRCEYLALPSGRNVGQESGHVPPQHLATSVPLPTSLMAGIHHCMADMGAFMGRSFRVGWGPGWKLAHTGPSLSHSLGQEQIEEAPTQPSPSAPSFLFLGSFASQPKAMPSTEGPRYKLQMEKLHMMEPQSHTISAVTEACLECILEHSILKEDSPYNPVTSCPLFQPNCGPSLLHQLADTVEEHAYKWSLTHGTLAEILHLCVALWGDLSFFSPESDGESEYIISRARVEAVSQWLESVSESVVQKEVMMALAAEQGHEGYLDAIFSHLTARQISSACVISQDKGDHHLALLLSQVCFGQDAPRQFLAQQLANWAEGGTDVLMAPARLNLYALLAGSPTHQASHATVNTCLGLDWRRAFALHLWYICPATSTLAEALQEYEQAAGLTGDAPSYCGPPYPPYMARATLPNGQKISYDVCYHLLKLFADPMHQLEALLNPATITADPLDISVSWVLWLVLESLSYTHLSHHHQASLHLSMASLLEGAGSWHWAIFVLLNIDDGERRRKEVESVLLRHVVVESEEVEDSEYTMRQEFVINRLGIPKMWIHKAKATKARSLGMIDEEAWFLLEAGDLNRAHSLIIDTIAPNSIINEDHDYLRKYLDKACTGGAVSKVVDWATGGGVYLDYLEMCAVVEDMKTSGEPTPALVEQLRPRLLALCARLNNLKGTTATHRLCVSEMSRVVVGVLRAVVGDGSDATQVLSQQLSGLPLTHDYALAELNLVTTHYLTHLSAET
ncbi:hypothetical protein Pcinc_004721 [Petrolisthes cinctipes]|uniref:Nuclear pore complex protein Nup98-Nup96 n=1 Tax=Petrolisthes cinctipes TaxID=88211 RepID=A0AAE1GGL3_PETCI|nr:hypothetical protein Pcinc_004721 [Petrolisthes cinctipes]